jgi:hypothetical protein
MRIDRQVSRSAFAMSWAANKKIRLFLGPHGSTKLALRATWPSLGKTTVRAKIKHRAVIASQHRNVGKIGGKQEMLPKKSTNRVFAEHFEINTAQGTSPPQIDALDQ